jgi:hypothetical protein
MAFAPPPPPHDFMAVERDDPYLVPTVPQPPPRLQPSNVPYPLPMYQQTMHRGLQPNAQYPTPMSPQVTHHTQPPSAPWTNVRVNFGSPVSQPPSNTYRGEAVQQDYDFTAQQPDESELEPALGLTPDSRGFVLNPPAPFGTWLTAPANPVLGLGGLAAEDLTREDFKFYCDPCQKGFNSKRIFDLHMAEHVYCSFPGCKFTCRVGKEWKMELHAASLHNRPDAPNLLDSEAYLSNRKGRFPTVETVKTKVDELYFRAARGEVLPDERRRWLKQHGVYVSKKWFMPVLREGDEALEMARKRRADKRERGPGETHQPYRRQPSGEPSDAGNAATSTLASEDTGSGGAATMDDMARFARRPGQKMLPLGPNGRYTKTQLVQMVRERYDAAMRVPAFYVCNRCGEKGHWVEACPKGGDKRFDVDTQWAEDRPTFNRAAQPKPAPADLEAPTPLPSDAAPEAPPTGDEPALVEMSARKEDVDPALVGDDTAPRVLQPALQFRLDAAKARSARRAATATLEEGSTVSADAALLRRHHRGPQRNVAPPVPTLFERLTADQHLNSQGVLLQAIRFFVANGFLDDMPQDNVQAGDEAAGEAGPTGGRRRFEFKRVVS